MRPKRSAFFREAQKLPDDVARAARRAEILQQFNLWPLTAQAVPCSMSRLN